MSGSLWCEKGFCYDPCLCIFNVRIELIQNCSCIWSTAWLVPVSDSILLHQNSSCRHFWFYLLAVLSCSSPASGFLFLPRFPGTKSTLTESLKPGAKWTHKRSLFLFKRDCFLLLETKSLPLMLETEDIRLADECCMYPFEDVSRGGKEEAGEGNGRV